VALQAAAAESRHPAARDTRPCRSCIGEGSGSCVRAGDGEGRRDG
jgi:hypothetical protein